MRELDLLEHIFGAGAALDGAAVTIPPGDDMGAVSVDGRQVLVTTDQIADGVHFDLAATSLERIGRKAITRNLSDVAAMAAVPVAAVAAAALPRDFGEARANALFDAMRTTAAQYACPLIGGDISIWDGKLIITVTILARAGAVDPVLRSGAKAGDLVFVTGQLGGSLLAMDAYTHHLDFEPRIGLARQLSKMLGPDLHAMIDLSDGLASDLAHVCRASNVRAEITSDRLPISPAAQAAAKADGRDAWRHALADGEDYELCLAVSPDVAARVPDEMKGVAITDIGRIESAGDGPLITLRWDDGRAEPLTESGWEHHGQ